MTDSSESKSVDQLVAELAGQNGAERQKARRALVEMGSSSLPALMVALDDPRQHVRWEAAKTLVEIADPTASDALVRALDDKDSDVRWVAGEALIALKRDALKPLLTALIQSQESEGLYKSAHHVLHDLSQRSDFAAQLSPVLKALEQLEPEIAVPGAAQRALEELP